MALCLLLRPEVSATHRKVSTVAAPSRRYPPQTLTVAEIMKQILVAITLFASISSMPFAAKAATAQTQTTSMRAEQGIVKLPDASIEYFSRGQGEPIILLPGGVLTVAYLDGLAEALSKAGYRVVGINFRGSGKSTGQSDGVTMQTLANDVVGVIQALKLGPVHLAGNDYGNRIARMVAMSHPELTRSVILLGAGGKVAPQPDAQRALVTFFTPNTTDVEMIEALRYFVANAADAPRVWEIIKPSRAPGAAGIERRATEATPLSTWWAPAGQTRYLILQGADDQIAPPENGEILKKDLGTRASLVSVPGAAHFLPVEQPELTAKHVLSFLRQLPKP
jgi:pimeloyl-ACP methyl ester carboxylesterase